MSACLLCGSDQSASRFRGSDRLYHTTKREFAIVECGGCGLMRLDPPPPPAELGQYYPANYWFAPDESGGVIVLMAPTEGGYINLLKRLDQEVFRPEPERLPLEGRKLHVHVDWSGLPREDPLDTV